VFFNVQYLEQLKKLASDNNLTHEVLSKEDRMMKWTEADVVFLPDISELQKVQLLSSSLTLLYTPSGEHFGIVPVEAMLSSCAVIGVNNGGLLETVTTDKKNGLLCNPDGHEFAQAMLNLIKEAGLAKKMGQNGKERAINLFSLQRLGAHLEEIMLSMLGLHTKQQ
jgi:alpha-1,3/alpha-1,6-mannosyltransferase